LTALTEKVTSVEESETEEGLFTPRKSSQRFHEHLKETLLLQPMSLVSYN